MATVPVCACACHSEALGNQRVMAHRGDLFKVYQYAQRALRYVGVLCTDPQEAALACAACRNAHAVALSSRPPVELPPKAEWIDPPVLPPPIRQADGEGAE